MHIRTYIAVLEIVVADIFHQKLLPWDLSNKKCPDYQGIILIFQVSLYNKGPLLGVWIMQVSSLFSSVLINRYICSYVYTSEDYH